MAVVCCPFCNWPISQCMAQCPGSKKAEEEEKDK